MPPVETPLVHSTHRYLLWIGLLFCLVIGVLVWRIVFPVTVSYTPTPATIDTVFPRQAPIPTDADYTAVQKGFQYLVSYRNASFSPISLFVGKGEVVRFTNNSEAVLNLSVSTNDIKILEPGTYFEYATTANGIVTYGDGATQGSITVQ